ncbi:MAG: mannose-6-phosphate isomerase [Salinivirgaceae bacterium]|nr:MAG: mannose-6-phosphate isomerase [Salinivirgaceae bacterium]
MSQLYPLKFQPIFIEKVWGGNRLKQILNKEIPNDKTGESWEISAVEGKLSVVSNGFLAGNTIEEVIEIYIGDLVGERIFEEFGTVFPLLFKFIDANDVLSVQVHPDNELAMKKHEAFGKTELWYVVDSDPDAYIYAGFQKGIKKNDFAELISAGEVKDSLRKENVKKGDVFFIPAGLIHATGPGVLFAEIQQTSDLTYRVYDWDRKDNNGKLRELHVEEALEAIHFHKVNSARVPYKTEPGVANTINKNDYFTINKLVLNDTYTAEYNNLDCFVVFMCLNGNAKLDYGQGGLESIQKGETVLIPSVLETIKIIPENEVEIVEAYVSEN